MRVRRCPLVQHNECGDDADIFAHLDFRHCCLGDIGVLGQDLFDFKRCDAVSHGVHEVVITSQMSDVAVIVHDAEIAAAKPFATHYEVFFVRPVPVSEHQAGVRTMNRDKAFLAGR